MGIFRYVLIDTFGLLKLFPIKVKLPLLQFSFFLAFFLSNHNIIMF